MIDEVKIPSNFYAIVKWAGIIIIIGGIKLTSSLILPFLLALFTSLMLLQPVHWLISKKIPRIIATLLVLVIFSSFLFLIGELLGSSINNFSQNIPQYKETLFKYIDRNEATFDVFGLDISKNNIFNAEPGKIMSVVLNGLDHMKQIIGKVFFIMLLTLFLLFELDSFPTKFNAMFSRVENKKANMNLKKIIVNLRNYLGIKTLTSLATGLLIYLGLLIIGVKYAVLWGTLAFLLNYIPNIGSLIAAIPAVLFAGIQLGSGALIWTGVLYLGVNFLIGSILEPRIMGKGMGLSIAVILISLMFWGWLFGPIGMFLSVPLSMVLKVLLQSNESSKYFAILIGTEDEAKLIIERDKKHHKRD